MGFGGGLNHSLQISILALFLLKQPNLMNSSRVKKSIGCHSGGRDCVVIGEPIHPV